MPEDIVKIGPQPGPQTDFLTCSADICGYGGAAGGGKTYALLLQPLVHIHNPNFQCVTFRRVATKTKLAGGMWDESMKIYPLADARPRDREQEWIFPSGARHKFAGIQYERDVYGYQGAQIPLINFDELTHFTERQFLYLLSRNRSGDAGVKPYIRATMNPDPNSWVKRFFAPWVDRDSPLKAESGEVLYWRRGPNNTHEYSRKPYDRAAKTVTFIRSTVYDNKKLLEANPDYLTNLESLDEADRRALLEGSWEFITEGKLFDYRWMKVIDDYDFASDKIEKIVRYWDMAMSMKPNKDLDFACGAKVVRTVSGKYFLVDLVRVRTSPMALEALITSCAIEDGYECEIIIEQEGGSQSVGYIDKLRRENLKGYRVIADKTTVAKRVRAKPLASAIERSVFFFMRALWNGQCIAELCAFPDGEHDDVADSVGGAYSFASKKTPSFDIL